MLSIKLSIFLSIKAITTTFEYIFEYKFEYKHRRHPILVLLKMLSIFLSIDRAVTPQTGHPSDFYIRRSLL